MATNLVRVRLSNGSEASVSESLAKTHDLKVLDKPATRHGRAIPAKPQTSVAQSAESKNTTTAGSDKSASQKEESK